MSNVISLHAYKQMKIGIEPVSKSVVVTVSDDKDKINSKLNIVFACSDLIDSIDSSVITRYALLPVSLILRGIRNNYLLRLYTDIRRNKM